MEIGEAVGQRVRELRTEVGATQDDLARACQRAGVTEWRANRIGQIESGAVSATVTMLFALARGLSAILERPVALAELIPEDATLQAGRKLTVFGAELRKHLEGEPVTRGFSTVPDAELQPGWGAADDKAVADLGIDAWAVLVAARELWGKTATVTTERDRRAGPGATPQKRGRVTRLLIAEVAAEYDRMCADEDADEDAEGDADV